MLRFFCVMHAKDVQAQQAALYGCVGAEAQPRSPDKAKGRIRVNLPCDMDWHDPAPIGAAPDALRLSGLQAGVRGVGDSLSPASRGGEGWGEGAVAVQAQKHSLLAALAPSP